MEGRAATVQGTMGDNSGPTPAPACVCWLACPPARVQGFPQCPLSPCHGSNEACDLRTENTLCSGWAPPLLHSHQNLPHQSPGVGFTGESWLPQSQDTAGIRGAPSSPRGCFQGPGVPLGRKGPSCGDRVRTGLLFAEMGAIRCLGAAATLHPPLPSCPSQDQGGGSVSLLIPSHLPGPATPTSTEHPV